jgi:uncharacterized protein YoxC
MDNEMKAFHKRLKNLHKQLDGIESQTTRVEQRLRQHAEDLAVIRYELSKISFPVRPKAEEKAA